MKLFEYEGKNIFKKHGIEIPKGYVIKQISDITDTDMPVVIKAQVLFGSRGKRGLIKQAHTKQELIEISTELFKKKDILISRLLIENRLDISREYYLSLFINRETKKPSLIVSQYGGIDIEKNPKEIYCFEVDPFVNLSSFLLRNITYTLGLSENLAKKFTDIVQNLFRIFKDYKAELVEINPLVLTKDENFVAADAKIIIDDSIAFVMDDIKSLSEKRDLSDFEYKVNQLGAVASEIQGGNIGVVTSGAGLLMATVDFIEHSGGKVGVGIDVAEIAFDKDTNRLKKLFNYIKKVNLDVLLISFFLQIGRCDVFARSIYESLNDVAKNTSIIIRLKGNFQEEARNILKETNFIILESFQEAIKIAVNKSLEG